ncbi:MAG: glycosyltransferase [Nitrospirales bacterium]
MRVALIHDWLTGMRGGERCLEIFCELFPDAPIYTLIHQKGSVSQIIERHPIVSSVLNRLPWMSKHYRYWLPLFPRAIQAFNLKGFDCILSSSHCVAKGVRVPQGTCHQSYIHTPMRYIWDAHAQYCREGTGLNLGALGMKVFRHRLQQWDVQSNQHVHDFIANSHHVAERVHRHYGRKASVVHPPVDWQTFSVSEQDEGFYLMVTAFAPYKRVDLAIHAANEMKRPLKIVGRGQEEQYLKGLAGPTVEFLGWQPDGDVRELYRKCRAVLFPGEEDFGIVPLEAMACGKAVIAYGKGGVLETVLPLNPLPAIPPNVPPTGVFFYEQSTQPLINAIQLFESRKNEFSPHAIRAHIEPFDRVHFKERMKQVIMTNYEYFCLTQKC